MSEARKLDPQVHGSTSLDLGQNSGSEPAIGPLAPGGNSTAVFREAEAAKPKKRSRTRRLVNAALILSVIGLMSFAGGIAVTMSVLSGTLDLQTGWVKESLNTIKDLAHHFMHK